MIDKVSVQVQMHSQGVEFGVHTILHISFWQVLEDLYQSIYGFFEKLENHNNFDRLYRLSRIWFKLPTQNFNRWPILQFTFKVSWSCWVTNWVLYWPFALLSEICGTIISNWFSWCQDTRCTLFWNPRDIIRWVWYSSRWIFSRWILCRCPAPPSIILIISTLPCRRSVESYS